MPRKNREDVEKEIVAAQRGGRQINLRDWDLERVDLSGLNLTGADLRGVNLNYANLVSVNLTGADLSGIGWDVAVANAAFPGSSDLIYARNFGAFWRESTSSVSVMARMAMLTNVRVKQSHRTYALTDMLE